MWQLHGPERQYTPSCLQYEFSAVLLSTKSVMLWEIHWMIITQQRGADMVLWYSKCGTLDIILCKAAMLRSRISSGLCFRVACVPFVAILENHVLYHCVWLTRQESTGLDPIFSFSSTFWDLHTMLYGQIKMLHTSSNRIWRKALLHTLPSKQCLY